LIKLFLSFLGYNPSTEALEDFLILILKVLEGSWPEGIFFDQIQSLGLSSRTQNDQLEVLEGLSCFEGRSPRGKRSFFFVGIICLSFFGYTPSTECPRIFTNRPTVFFGVPPARSARGFVAFDVEGAGGLLIKLILSFLGYNPTTECSRIF